MSAPEQVPADLDDFLKMFAGDVVIEAYGTVTNPPQPDPEES